MLIVTIQNVGGGLNVADYDYKVYVNKELIASGSLFDYERARGWANLVKEVAEKEIEIMVAKAFERAPQKKEHEK